MTLDYRDQLQEIKEHVPSYVKPAKQKTPKVKIKESTPSNSGNSIDWIEDGVDHINILRGAGTSLGDFLAHGSRYQLTHNIFGKFINMESFWYFIKSEEKDDLLRSKTGRNLKKHALQLNLQNVVNFRAIVMDANYQKIKEYPSFLKLMQESTLPFDCYHINNEHQIRQRPVYYKWLVSGFEEIRTALKEGREPDFTLWMDNPYTSIYAAVTNTLNDDSRKVLDYLESNP